MAGKGDTPRPQRRNGFHEKAPDARCWECSRPIVLDEAPELPDAMSEGAYGPALVAVKVCVACYERLAG